MMAGQSDKLAPRREHIKKRLLDFAYQVCVREGLVAGLKNIFTLELRVMEGEDEAASQL